MQTYSLVKFSLKTARFDVIYSKYKFSRHFTMKIYHSFQLDDIKNALDNGFSGSNLLYTMCGSIIVKVIILLICPVSMFS